MSTVDRKAPSWTYQWSAEVGRLLDKADDIAVAGGAADVGIAHILMAMLADPSLITSDLLEPIDPDPCVVFTRLLEAARRAQSEGEKTKVRR